MGWHWMHLRVNDLKVTEGTGEGITEIFSVIPSPVVKQLSFSWFTHLRIQCHSIFHVIFKWHDTSPWTNSYSHFLFQYCFSGCRSGAIHHHDVRVADHHVATLSRHSQEVCGLKWSPDGKFLASGGNDNLLLVWDASINTITNSNTPLHTLNQHQAAVKVSRLVVQLPYVLTSFF